MKKTPLLGLAVSAAFLVSCASCNRDFDWDPRPYVGDSASEAIVNGRGEVVSCAEPRFDSFTCFDPQNIAELRTAISQVTNDKDRRRLEEAMRTLDTRVWFSKDSRAKLHDLTR